MAKKATKDDEGIPIVWSDNGIQTVLANQLIVTTDETEAFLSFYLIEPPAVIAEDGISQSDALKNIKEVKANCVAKIAIGRSRLKVLANALNNVVKLMDERMAKKQ